MEKYKIEREMKLTHDCVGEYTVPDYLPPVGKLLAVECDVIPDDVYIKEGTSGLAADLCGAAVFRAYWVSEGEEGNEPSSATFRCDYETSAVLGNLSSPVCRVTTVPEGVFCRVTGPRKLSVRARLQSRLTAAVPETGATPEAVASEGVEQKLEGITAALEIFGTARDLFVTAHLPEGGAPVACRAAVGPVAASLSSPTECRLDGEITVLCRYGADGGFRDRTVTVPFSETVPLDTPSGITSEALVGCSARGVVTSTEIRSDNDGDAIGATLEIMYDLFAEALLRREGDVVRDAYSCEGVSSCEYKTVEYLSPVAALSASVTVNETADLHRMGKVELITGSATVESAAVKAGRLRVSGSLSGVATLLTDGEYETVPYSVPWKYDVSLPSGVKVADPSALVFSGEATHLTLSGRADSGLHVTSEVALSVTVTEKRSVTEVASLAVLPAAERRLPCITVYYPSADEEPWDVAKRFRVPEKQVATAENVDENGALRRVVVI